MNVSYYKDLHLKFWKTIRLKKAFVVYSIILFFLQYYFSGLDSFLNNACKCDVIDCNRGVLPLYKKYL